MSLRPAKKNTLKTPRPLGHSLQGVVVAPLGEDWTHAGRGTMKRGLAGAVLVLALVSAVVVWRLHSAHTAELISQDDRALLNPLNMMKQLAAIKGWTEPQGKEQRIPKRAVLEAQVLAKQQAVRDKAALVTQAHSGVRLRNAARRAGRAEPAAQYADAEVDDYETRAKSLAAKSHQDSETASELSAKAQVLAAEAKKQEQLSRRADQRGEQLIRKAGVQSQELKKQANVEDSQAKHLVLYAKRLAQRMVKEEALDEMKKWMAAKHTKSARAPRGRPRVERVRDAHRSVEVAQSQTRGVGRADKVPLTALRARAAGKPSGRPETEGDKIRDEFKDWRTSKLAHYAKEHDLYTKTQFCNSRATAHSPSIAELRAAFGSDWQDVPPRVASLAAVNGCMVALGLRANDSTPVDVWDKGALKGKAGQVRACAHGDRKVPQEMRT